MYILGINGGFGGGYQDACACLYADGKIIAAVEEERLNKIKYSTGIFPLKSVREVLSIGNISIEEVSTIAFHGSTWKGSIEEDIRSFFIHHFGHCPNIQRFHHHDAHAASTYYLSGFDEALVVTMDNSGDGISTQIMTGKDGVLSLVKRWERPDSFGTFYSCMTQLAGFDRDADEYKLMGLAPYGHPEAYDLSDVLYLKENGDYALNRDYIYPIQPSQSFPNKQIPLYSAALLRKTGIDNIADIRNTDIQQNIAAATQKHLEHIVTNWLNYWIAQTGLRNICLAGGVAMNCVLNQKILQQCNVENIFIPPFAGDQGISIGNAFLAAYKKPVISHFSAYTGRHFQTQEVELILQQNNIAYSKPTDITDTAAQYIADGKIIGWFQGNAEIGARALGNRSMLACPAIPGMKDKINRTIKFRESFRPFCPSVLAEDFSIYFSSSLPQIPYMNITADCTELTKNVLPEIVHADGTARVQTVSSENNSIFHQLICKVKEKTGYGVVLNTSLNVRHQPMAYDVNDALITLFTSGLDALFIEDILIEK